MKYKEIREIKGEICPEIAVELELQFDTPLPRYGCLKRLGVVNHRAQ
jgi:hypothetical protein